MSGRFEFDFFLSHSSVDKPAVRELAERLRGDGLRVWFDEWEIRPGDSIPAAIEQGLIESRTLILFMSGNAFASEWVTLERHTAMFRDPTNQERRFVPLLLEDCEIRETLRQFAYVDWRERDAGEYGRLLRVCGRADQPVEERPEGESVVAEEARVHAPPSQSRTVSLGHTDSIRSVAISQDGKQALSGAEDNTLRLWDLESGRCLRTMEGHTEGVRSVVISHDGTQALSGADDKTLRLWDLESGECVKILRGHTNRVRSVAISPDGKRALSGANDTTLRLWDLESGRCLRILKGHTNWVRSVEISQDGRQALSGAEDNTLRLWDLQTGRCLKTLEGHTNWVRSVAISQDGKRALSGAKDETLRLWDLESGKCLHTLEGHTAPVYSTVLSQDGTHALSGGEDNTLRLWDLESGRCLKILKGHTGRVWSVAITQDGTQALSGGEDNTLRLWDLESEECLKIMEGHTNTVYSVAISQDGTQALSGADDNTLRLWDLESGKCRRTLEGHVGTVRSVAISQDGTRALSGSADKTLRLWDLENGKCLRTLEGHTSIVYDVAISRDGEHALSGAADKTLRLWDLQTGRCVKILEGHTNWVRSVAISQDGKHALSGANDKTLQVWDLEDKAHLKTMEGHTNTVYSVAIGQDGTRALSGAADNTLRLWDLESGRCLMTLEGHMGTVRSMAINQDGTRALSGAADNTLRLWDLESGKCLMTMEGHTRTVTSVAIRRNGTQTIAYSAAGNGVLRIWELAAPIEAEKEAMKQEATQYTNAKVLLVGDSGVGKSGLRIRLTEDRFEPTASTDAHETVKTDWATHVKLPHDGGTAEIDREIWLWDFAGQADYRLIHQLFMDETALAVLVFNPQSEDPFDGIGQWDRDLMRAAKRKFGKLLVAGRCDRGKLMVSRDSAEEFARKRGYGRYLETSAMSGEGCEALRDAIVETIDWKSIPWTTSPRIFKVLKDEILKLRKEGKVLLRLAELKQQLQFRLPTERFTLAELRAVVGLLAGPGLVWQLEFGEIVLLQPEWINKYAAAVIRSVREIGEIGVIDEAEVLSGDLEYTVDVVRREGEGPAQIEMQRLGEADEAIVLRAMHQMFVDHGLCVRERVDGKTQLVLPSYVKRELPTDPGHPPVLVTYRFNGQADNIYATLVVQLRQTRAFDNGKLWRYAADFESPGGHRMGVKMERHEEGRAEIKVYFDPSIHQDTMVTFIKYVHEHLLEKGQDVVRLRHFACSHCGHPVHDVEMARSILEKAGKDAEIRCQNWECDKRFALWDLIEQKFASDEFRQRVQELEERARQAIDAESEELILVGHAFAIAREAGQIFRPIANSDHGIDGEIKFKDRDGKESGRRVYLQLKSEDSYLKKRKDDGVDIFWIKKARWAEYWQQQAYPVMLVVRTSDGEARWMDVSRYLEIESGAWQGPVKQVVFDGEAFTAASVRRMRDRVIGDDG